ncbi:hypothetical protein H5410_038619 [Solanum commersonii]|uniref:Uncharacterized protein n=1 Tax=Solanum commersonii TaxID=4109 RepID=A0A9J5Y9H4_SOLCO|nr:hypothetical protein H5410_038619 [Solanum commersonii]
MQVRRERSTKEETNSRKEEEKRNKENCKSSKSKGTKEKRENGGTPFESDSDFVSEIFLKNK